MRYLWMIATSACVMLLAQPATAARYYEFQLRGSAILAGSNSPPTKDVNYESFLTFSFDAANDGSDFSRYIASGPFSTTVLATAPGRRIANLSTLNTPAGAVFSFNFLLSDVAEGDSLAVLNISDNLFSYRIQPDGRYSYTVSTGLGQISSILARTSNDAPTALGLNELTTASPIPETSTWASMILGSSFVGGLLRKPRKSAAVA